MLLVGEKAPDFEVLTDSNELFKLSAALGKKVLVYFYPKDDTPGCTTEACDFREALGALNALNCVVIGISKDSVASHKKFKEKYALNFPLGADESGEVCQKYGVWSEKSMFGKKYFGIVRATFLIDEKGNIQHVWPKVKVGTHVQEILDILK